ncbi:MAG TPA: hypothetical protein PLP17_04410, partial [Oligoflexia bacterium]|nr:hypothetical protein [Oligoflexia bacterium]
PAYGRIDYPAHKYGQTLVGSAAWIPDDRSSRFSLRNMRYYYDNSALEERFVAAAAVEGTAAAGRPLALPLDTTDGSEVIEIVNALNHTQLVTVLVYDAAGAEAAQIAFDLAAHATRHVIVDSLLDAQASTRGLAVVQGGSAAGIAAAALKYGRTAEMGINYAYSSPLREALGASLRTSYNTFLGQGCLMLAGNTTASSQTLLLSMQRTDGTAVLAGLELTIPAHGTIAYDICSHESSEQYGAITVTPALANTLTASLIRTGAGNTYRFALQAR